MVLANSAKPHKFFILQEKSRLDASVSNLLLSCRKFGRAAFKLSRIDFEIKAFDFKINRIDFKINRTKFKQGRTKIKQGRTKIFIQVSQVV